MWETMAIMLASQVASSMLAPKTSNFSGDTSSKIDGDSPWERIKPADANPNKFLDKPNTYFVGKPEQI